MVEVHLSVWLWVWGIAAIFAFVRSWREGAGAGLIFTYVLTFGTMHWLAAFLYTLPWHRDTGLDFTALGMRESAIAMVAFAVGSEVSRLFLGRHRPTETAALARPLDRRLPTLYLVGGTFLYLIVLPVANRLPSITSVVATGSILIVVGIGLKCWDAWLRGRTSVMWAWLGSTVALPLLTVVVQGFLGYGFAAMLTVLAFVASFLRPRWKVAVLGLVLTQLGLSVYVTYMRDRRDIRAVVWSGAGVSDRLTQLQDTFANVEWFDPANDDHLRRIDQRLNQDYLLGTSVAYLEGGSMDFAHGSTMLAAALALVPRAIWPDKPVVGGSGDLASMYTGLRFAEGTSVGIGQVMEAYINFGRDGVIVCFFLFGALLTVIDYRSSQRLYEGNAASFLMWYMPGLSLLQVGGSFAEASSSAAAALVMAIILKRTLMRLMPDRRLTERGVEANDPVPGKLSA